MSLLIPRRPRGRGGYLLVEMAVAMLLVALVTAGIMGVLLNVKQQGKKVQMKEQFSMQVNMLVHELKAYVTDDLSITDGAPGSPPWHLPGDPCPSLPSDCWALEAGEHDATSLLPASLKGAPHNGTMTYQVTVDNSRGVPMRKVDVNVSWTPQQV